MATCGGCSPGENTQIFGGSACFLPELNVKPDTLKGKRFGVPRMFINKDELAGTGENPGIGGPTGQRIHTRASVIDLWEAARKHWKRLAQTLWKWISAGIKLRR